MAVPDAQDAIESFLHLEERLMAFCKIVPFVPAHYRVHSPTLASMLLDCGSLSESIFKSTMDNAHYNARPTVDAIRGRRYTTAHPFYNINDSRTVFRSDQLYNKSVWYIPRSDSSMPWHAWQKTTGNPAWWRAYNLVKHSRFANQSRATLSTVMHAIEATFLQLVCALDYRDELINQGIIRCSAMDISSLKTAMTGLEPFSIPHKVIARSGVFGYKFRTTGSPGHARDISVFL